MPFRRRVKLATINSAKHIIHHSIFSVTTGTIVVTDEAVSVDVPDVTAANEVRSGAVIKAIYIEAWILSNSGTVKGTFNITVEKSKGGQPDMTFGQSVALNAYPNKANIFYTTQGIIGDESTNPVPILRQWIAIPKGKQRMAFGDKIKVNYSATITGIQVCGISVYKEYF